MDCPWVEPCSNHNALSYGYAYLNVVKMDKSNFVGKKWVGPHGHWKTQKL